MKRADGLAGLGYRLLFYYCRRVRPSSIGVRPEAIVNGMAESRLRSCRSRIGQVSVLAITLLLAASLAQSKTLKTPSVDEILARYTQMMGGKAAFEKVKTMVLRGTIEFPANKLSGTTTEYFVAPDHFLAVTEVPGYGTLRTGFDGKSGWRVDRKGAVTELSGADLADVRRRADILWHVKLKELYPGLRLKGRESFEGKDAWVLEARDSWIFDLCFDVETGLLVRFDTDTGEPNGASKVLISDYRPVGGVRFSYGAAMVTDKIVWRRTLTEVQFNVPVDDQLFQKT
jgi:hypothetical protein